MKKLFLVSIFTMIMFGLFAQDQNVIIIKNISVFNGVDEELKVSDVLIRGNMIEGVSTIGFAEESNPETQIIDGTGKFVIPGLIDAHTHITFQDLEVPLARATMEVDWATINLIAVKAAERQLMRGFTTIRNMGGNAIPLAKVIDRGILPGPRILPSGAFISQSGGHGDFGSIMDVPRTPGHLSYGERVGFTAIADGVDEVLKRSREQLRQGASQLKLMAGGGVTSDFDPLDVTQYSIEEMKAAVLAAENWGTHVAVHAYTPDAIQKAILAGVKVIEHGQLADEETVKMMAEYDVWWSPQAFLSVNYPNRNPAVDTLDMTPVQRDKYNAVSLRNDNALNVYKWAKKYGVKTAFGTDLFGGRQRADTQGRWLASLKIVFTPYEIMKMVTSTNAELLQLSGPRHPYKYGKLGEISIGSYADLIILSENPLEKIDLLADPDRNFLVIMKDGIIYKNLLD